MNIAFDAKRLMKNYTGLGNYSRALVENLAKYEPDLQLYLYTPQVAENNRTRNFIQSRRYQIRTAPPKAPSELWRSLLLKKRLLEDKIDIYHGLSNQIPLGLKETSIKTIVTIHDLIFKTHPQTYPFIDRQIYNLKFKYACQKADLVVAISESTKKDIVRYYKTDENKIRVIYQPVHPVFYEGENTIENLELKQRYNLPAEFFLSVGSIEKRKNLLSIIKAMSLLSESYQLPLVVVGKGGNYKSECIRLAKELGIHKKILWLEKVGEMNELKSIYKMAKCLVYPSFYEGFGLPVVEAALCRTPVITSNVSSLPEAAGPKALIINPGKPSEIADAIKIIVSDDAYAREYGANLFQYAFENFNPQKTTEKMLHLYHELLST